MATLITEKMRNPQNENQWIPLRKIVDNDGTIDVLYLDAEGNPLNFPGPFEIKDGKVSPIDTVTALNRLGISWGTLPAEPTGDPNTIYIQLIEAE